VAATGTATQEVADLGPAANTAQAALSSLTQVVAADVQRLDAIQTPAAPATVPAVPASPATAEQPEPVTAATGGHIRGPGTTTSDSIPAMLSDKEYVLNAKAVERVGVDNLDAINSGTAHFADGGVVHLAAGGQAKPPHLGPGPHQITYDPDTGGAYIDGVLRLPNDPLLSDPVVKAEIEKSKAGMKDASSSQKSRDPFVGDFGEGRETGDTGNTPGFAAGGLVGHFAEGGVGSAPAIARLRQVVSQHFANGGRLHLAQGGAVDRASFRDSLSAMGLATVEMPHLAIGGMPDFHSPVIDDKSFGKSAPKSDNASVPHHTVDLRTDHGTFRMMSPEETVRQLKHAAIDAKAFSTGKKPGWYGGGGR
jgi:hypothetical protein